MDLSKVINHEKLYALQLLDPTEEQPIPGVGNENKGKFVTFNIRSIESDEVQAVSDKGTNKMLRRKKLNVDVLKDDYLDKAVAMIESWDWCGNEWKGERDPSFTPKNVRDVLEEGWIYRQVVEAADELENFT